MPWSFTVISRTRQWVRSSTPSRTATGQYVTSVLPFAPWAQPVMQGPRLTQAARPACSWVAIALSEGHQCQPSLLKPRPRVSPILPRGTGGSGASLGGYAGSPANPATPIIWAFKS